MRTPNTILFHLLCAQRVTSQIYALVYCRVVSKAHFINRFHEEYDIREKKIFFFLVSFYDNQHDLPGISAALII